jgi:hypothetical protein
MLRPYKGIGDRWAIGNLRRRILRGGRRICIVLEMRHLFGSSVEKAARLLVK